MTPPVDFVDLHNIAKHCIYMREAFEAMLLTIEDLVCQHKQHFLDSSISHATASANLHDPIAVTDALATQNMLKHKRSFFESTKLRIASLETRIENIIALVSYSVKSVQTISFPPPISRVISGKPPSTFAGQPKIWALAWCRNFRGSRR